VSAASDEHVLELGARARRGDEAALQELIAHLRVQLSGRGVSRQTYTTREIAAMTQWSPSTIYRKLRKRRLIALAHEEGEGVRGDGLRFPIPLFHAMYPELHFPFQQPLLFPDR
jgi:hypothetical protein